MLNWLKPWIKGIYKAFRPLLGPDDVCIYPIPCSTYAWHTLLNKPLYKSVPLIIFRLLSCNPITALIRLLLARLAKRQP
ncbi:MAG: membrane protein insertion efficiency factor YidD [Pseudomonadota bacterium]